MTFLILAKDAQRRGQLAERLRALAPESLCLSLPPSSGEAALQEVAVDVVVCPPDSPVLYAAPHAVPWPEGEPTDAWLRSLLSATPPTP